MFDEFEQKRRFRQAWESVEIVRAVEYSLFTFGESVLRYFLICGEAAAGKPVAVSKGEVRIQRPMIITPDSDRPELSGFFEDSESEEEGIAQFLLTRTAQFSNLRLKNQHGENVIDQDGMDAAVTKLNLRLDSEEEDQIAILTAPPRLGGIAVLRYATERVLKSSPDNIQELRERGFLP